MALCLDDKQSFLDKRHIHFDDNQRLVLKESFAKDPYPTQDTIKILSDVLGVDKRKVRRWFSSERCRLRKKKVPFPTQCKLSNLSHEILAFGVELTMY